MKQLLTRHRAQSLQRGQSMIEMAVGFVLLLIILSGVIDLGRAYFVYIALEDGAGEAALYLSIDPDCRMATDAPKCADPNNAEYRAQTAGGANVDWSTADITIERPAVYGVGDPVKVSIEYSLPLLTPFVPRFAGINPVKLKVEAAQVIIRED